MENKKIKELKSVFQNYNKTDLDFSSSEKYFIQLKANFMYLTDLVGIDFYYDKPDIVERQKGSIAFYKKSIEEISKEYAGILEEKKINPNLLIEKKINTFRNFIEILEKL